MITTAAPTAVAASASSDRSPPITASDDGRPPSTVSDFSPEETNLSDCLGLVERPGCGSDSRGGWRQTAVFVVVLIGLAVVFWRIAVGVRRNRAD